jgi:hypothetical protein
MRSPADEKNVAAAEPQYNPEVIERFAARLERRATALRRGFLIGGALIGASFGSVPLTPLGSAWPIPHLFGFGTLLLGAAVGALIGFVVGDGRAELHSLHAQTTLCQLHAQRATLAIWRLLQERKDEAAARPAPRASHEPAPVRHTAIEQAPPQPAPAPPVPVPVVSAPASVTAAAPPPPLLATPPPLLAPPEPTVAAPAPAAPVEPPVVPSPPLSAPPSLRVAPPPLDPPLEAPPVSA